MMKRAFTAPSMTALGSVAELTLGGHTGNFLDNNFPTTTPFSSLTFS